MIKLIKMVMYLTSSSLIPPATSCFHVSLLSEPVIKQLQPLNILKLIIEFIMIR